MPSLVRKWSKEHLAVCVCTRRRHTNMLSYTHTLIVLLRLVNQIYTLTFTTYKINTNMIYFLLRSLSCFMWPINLLTHNSESSLLWRVYYLQWALWTSWVFFLRWGNQSRDIHPWERPWAVTKSLTHTQQQLQPSEEGHLSLSSSSICPPLSVDPKCPADVDFNSTDMDIKTITSALKFYLRWVKHAWFYDVQKKLFF